MKTTIKTLVLAGALLAATACTSTRFVSDGARPPSEGDVLSRVLASVDQAVIDLSGLTPSPAVKAARLNLRVARSGLPSPAKPEHVKEAGARSALVMKGKDAEAEQASSATEQQIVADLNAARKERDDAKQALENERAAHAAAIEEAKKKAEAGIWTHIQFWGAATLYAIAITCLVLAVLRAKAAIASGLDIVAGLKSTAALLTLSSVCFSVARFMASDWFWWGCGGIVALFITYVGYLAVQESKGRAAQSALTPIRRALDRAYDSAAPEVQKDLEARVFNPIAEEMKAAKAARRFLHIDRAKDTTPPLAAPLPERPAVATT